jgi:hypothetical protein
MSGIRKIKLFMKWEEKRKALEAWYITLCRVCE